MRRLKSHYLNLANTLDAEANAEVLRLAHALLASGLRGLTDVVPGYGSLHLEYDPAVLPTGDLRRALETARSAPPASPPSEAGRVVELGVVYDGPDLEAVAHGAGVSAAEVVRRHSSTLYRAYAAGFAPGFTYLGDVDPVIRTPRLARPRQRVPAGSVGIADAQTGVYPLDSPGGWNLIGRAVTAVYDPRRAAPALIEAGDRVRFVPVEARDAPAAAPGPPPALELLPEAPRHPVFLVHEPGLLDLVVDEGRLLVGRFGLARSGPADPASAAIANGLVANGAQQALLEVNVAGPVLEALHDCVVALAGPSFRLLINGRAAEPYTATAVRRGDVLRFQPSSSGLRSYLAVAGGFQSGTFRGSASVDMRGRIGRPLRAGDVLGVDQRRRSRAGFSFSPHGRATATLRLRLLPGPQFDGALVAALAERPLRIIHTDRVGVRLETSGAAGGGVISEGNPLGAVQLTAGGDPIILLNDRGTMGGYTKPAVVDPRDLPRLAQARAGTLVRFVLPQ